MYKIKMYKIKNEKRIFLSSEGSPLKYLTYKFIQQ